MKISPISFLSTKNNFKTLTSKNAYVSKPNFTGSDSFQKRKTDREDKVCSNVIKNYVKHEALKDDKTLRFDVLPFNTNLKTLLRIGKKINYQSYQPTVRTPKDATSITYGAYDDELKAPSTINFWRNGKVIAYFDIYKLEPKMSYSYTKYEDGVEKQYVIEDGKITSFFACDKKGEMVFHYVYDNGFKRQEAARIKNNEALIITELLYDGKNPENSYYKENTDDGILEYKFDKSKNMWLLKNIIAKPENN